MGKTFTSKKNYLDSLKSVYDFHDKVYDTIVALLKKKGDIELKSPIRFCFLDMEGTYTINAVRLTDNKIDFYLDASDENGGRYKLGWEEIHYDMMIIEWLMGLKWHDTFSDYNYEN